MGLSFNDRVRVNETHPIESWHGREGTLITEAQEEHAEFHHHQVRMDGDVVQHEFLATELTRVTTTIPQEESQT